MLRVVMKEEILNILKSHIEENEGHIHYGIKTIKKDVENAWLGSLKVNLDQVKICYEKIELLKELHKEIDELSGEVGYEN